MTPNPRNTPTHPAAQLLGWVIVLATAAITLAATTRAVTWLLGT